MILGGLGFWLVGYGLAFGEGNNGFIGTSYFASIGLPREMYPHLFFQVHIKSYMGAYIYQEIKVIDNTFLIYVFLSVLYFS